MNTVLEKMMRSAAKGELNPSPIKPFIGYKSLNADMLGHNGTKFLIGETYEVVNGKMVVSPSQDRMSSKVILNSNLQLCSNQVIHYYQDKDMIGTYYNVDGYNRHFEVEILGNYKDGGDKSGTTKLKILREITEEIHVKKYEKEFGLKTIEIIQKENPSIILGGSIALFLQGIKLDRLIFDGRESDYDFISPYYVNLEEEVKFSKPLRDLSESNSKNEYKQGYTRRLPSGCDFQSQFSFKGRKMDLRIDPEVKYTYVTYSNVRYKVCKWEDILMAKLKYVSEGGESAKKHHQDIFNLITRK